MDFAIEVQPESARSFAGITLIARSQFLAHSSAYELTHLPIPYVFSTAPLEYNVISHSGLDGVYICLSVPLPVHYNYAFRYIFGNGMRLWLATVLVICV